MAHITARYEKSHSLLAWVRGVVGTLRESLERHRAFERVYGELSLLSDRELSDIGLTRSQIVQVAWDSVDRD